MVSIFQVKTDPNQAIKQACLRKKLYYKTFPKLYKTLLQELSANSAFSFFLYLKTKMRNPQEVL